MLFISSLFRIRRCHSGLGISFYEIVIIFEMLVLANEKQTPKA